jgi:hypothetical protein
MAYYKEKYGGREQAGRDSRRGGRSGSRQSGAKPETRKSAAHPAETQKAGQGQTKAETPEKKQGLIGKLLGIFGRKT